MAPMCGLRFSRRAEPRNSERMLRTCRKWDSGCGYGENRLAICIELVIRLITKGQRLLPKVGFSLELVIPVWISIVVSRLRRGERGERVVGLAVILVTSCHQQGN